MILNKHTKENQLSELFHSHVCEDDGNGMSEWSFCCCRQITFGLSLLENEFDSDIDFMIDVCSLLLIGEI